MNPQNEKRDTMTANVPVYSKNEKTAMINTLMNIGHFIERLAIKVALDNPKDVERARNFLYLWAGIDESLLKLRPTS